MPLKKYYNLILISIKTEPETNLKAHISIICLKNEANIFRWWHRARNFYRINLANLLCFLGYDCEKCTTYWQTVKTDKASCVDRNKLCPTWSKRRDCIINKDFMMSNCCASCSPCKDRKHWCEGWARIFIRDGLPLPRKLCNTNFFKENAEKVVENVP